MKKSILLLLVLMNFAVNAQMIQLQNYCGNTTFNLPSANGQIVGNDNPDNYVFTFHLTQSDAALGANPIANPENFQSPASQIIFVRAEHLTLIDAIVVPIALIVNTTLNVGIALSMDMPTSTLFAETFGGQGPYTYEWSFNGTAITGEAGQSIVILGYPSGTWSLTVVDANGCSGSDTFSSSNPITISANNDTFTLTNSGGITPPGIGNILTNDFLNNLPATLNNVAVSVLSTPNIGIGINAQGMVYATEQTPSGTYTLVYQICELQNPSNCDTATVTITVDYCRAATPIIDSVVQPTCVQQTGTVNVSGLPEMGSWNILLLSADQPMNISGTGTTASIPNLQPGVYTLNVTAEDILQANCYASFNINFIIEDLFQIDVLVNPTYVDFNNDGYTNVGDTVEYTFTVINNSCGDITDVNIVSNLSVIGGPLAVLAQGAADTTTFSATYVITQNDINEGAVMNTATLTGFLNGIPLNDDYVILYTFDLDLSDGIKLNAFYDYNSNGTQDSFEPNFTFGEYQYAINDGTVNNAMPSDGALYLYESNAANSYDVGFTIDSAHAAYYSVSPATYSNITVANGSGMTTYNFPITVTPYNDLAVQIYNASAPPRPGFIYQNYISYSNYGNQTIASGTVTFVKDPLLTITTISESGAVANANGFTFDFVNLLPNQTRYITVSMQVPTIPTVALGQQVTNSCTISVPANDTNTNNNQSSITQTIVGSYDPNDKAESHGSEVVFSTFSADDYLTYTIRFENTGTANAVNVKVDDLLDSHLDETTVRTIASSHPYVLKRVNNALTWNFDGIDLPPSVDNDAVTGHGYIVFQVKPKTGFALGDIIPNTADIFFDFNPAIVTNTWTTEFVPFLGVNAFDASTFEYYPNPTSGIVTFHMKNTTTINSIEVIDILGKTLLSKTVNYSDANIDLSSLEKGIYLVKLKANGQEKTVKITKQ